jgi:hypothetical protein
MVYRWEVVVVRVLLEVYEEWLRDGETSSEYRRSEVGDDEEEMLTKGSS